jgi:glycosyltransferase involved in cell wall biosynthesis
LHARLAPDQPLSVAVDARWLGVHETGAQVAATRFLEHLGQLQGVSAIHLHDLPGGRLPDYAAALRRNPRLQVGNEPGDVFWRPAQPDDRTRMWLDRARGRRVVVTVLDLIEHTNPAYAPDARAWAARRARTTRYLQQADVVTAISADVVSHLALEVPGLDPRRLVATPLGVDAPGSPEPGAAPPARALTHRPFVLVLGNDYLHKNRDFAIRVFAKVARSHEVDLVLAGLTVPAAGATTAAAEAQLLESAGPLRERIHLLPHVTGPQKRWLLSAAAVVHYPTSAEGYGLLPHEAAAAGVPCVFTRFGPLAELFGDVPNPASWSVAEHAGRISLLLADPGERVRTVELLRSAGRSHTWQGASERLLESFRMALALPPLGHPRGGQRVDAVAARAVLALQSARDGLAAARRR